MTQEHHYSWMEMNTEPRLRVFSSSRQWRLERGNWIFLYPACCQFQHPVGCQQLHLPLRYTQHLHPCYASTFLVNRILIIIQKYITDVHIIIREVSFSEDLMVWRYSWSGQWRDIKTTVHWECENCWSDTCREHSGEEDVLQAGFGHHLLGPSLASCHGWAITLEDHRAVCGRKSKMWRGWDCSPGCGELPHSRLLHGELVPQGEEGPGARPHHRPGTFHQVGCLCQALLPPQGRIGQDQGD